MLGVGCWMFEGEKGTRGKELRLPVIIKGLQKTGDGGRRLEVGGFYRRTQNKNSSREESP